MRDKMERLEQRLNNEQLIEVNNSELEEYIGKLNNKRAPR